MNIISDTQTIEEKLRTLMPILKPYEVDHLLMMLSKTPVEINKPPEHGLIMIQTQDCFGVDFYLGELLVTTAEVECCGVFGHATIMGKEPLKATLAATVNAIIRSPKSGELDKIKPHVECFMLRLNTQCQQERKLTAATKVNFESMADEA
ncbi:phosphonate C-P lyase system protein PhnG [bacterium]|nr:phosphonate C-P lyase system protein PhnG [bacterium]